EKVVALRGREDVVDTAEQPEALDELVRDEDAVPRLHLFAEAEEIVDDLEPVLQKVQIDAEAAGRLLDSEATREWAEALGELQRETKRLGRRRGDRAVVGRFVGVGRIDARVGERREARRVVDEFELVVFV